MISKIFLLNSDSLHETYTLWFDLKWWTSFFILYGVLYIGYILHCQAPEVLFSILLSPSILLYMHNELETCWKEKSQIVDSAQIANVQWIQYQGQDCGTICSELWRWFFASIGAQEVTLSVRVFLSVILLNSSLNTQYSYKKESNAFHKHLELNHSDPIQDLGVFKMKVEKTF